MFLTTKQTTFNQLSKIETVTSVIPSSVFYGDVSTYGNIIQQRENILKTYFDEIVQNGGNIKISKNNDIYITKDFESLYESVATMWDGDSWMVDKDYYFFNVSTDERWVQSNAEWEKWKSNRAWSILERYMDEDDLDRALVDYAYYLTKIDEIRDEMAEIVFGVETPLYNWLEKAIPEISTMIDSPELIEILQTMKIRTLNISKYTDKRFWLFGFLKRIYPFIYMKAGKIKLLGHGGLIESYEDFTNNVNIESMNHLYSSIAVDKKNLMTICKWVNDEYYLEKLGKLKKWMFDDEIRKTVIGDEDIIEESVEVEKENKGTYINIEMKLDNAAATARLEEFLEDTFKDMVWIGTKNINYSNSKTKYFVDYGVNVPISQFQVQKNESFKQREGIKFVVAFVFSYDPDLFDLWQYVKQGRFITWQTFPIWTQKDFNLSGKELISQPLLNKLELPPDTMETIEYENWSMEDYEYDTTYINDGYIKGDYLYMTKRSQKTSAGYLGYEVSIKMKLPRSIYWNDGAISVITRDKIFNLHTVVSLPNVNDEDHIRDTVQKARYQLCAQLQQNVTMWVRNGCELIGFPRDILRRSGIMEGILVMAMEESLEPVSFYENDLAMDTFYENKSDADKATQRVFVRQLNIINEQYKVFTSLPNMKDTRFVYELKTFENTKHQNESWQITDIVKYTPTSLPVDFKASDPDHIQGLNHIYYNALVPTYTSNVGRGGGLIAKLEYRVQGKQEIKYITSKSSDFISGLSNSQQIRFDVQTFETDNLDKLLEDLFPTSSKTIKISLGAIKSQDDHSAQESLYLSNPFITNIVVNHNYLSEIDEVNVVATIYDQPIKTPSLPDPLIKF